jgi:hypothetical protein
MDDPRAVSAVLQLVEDESPPVRVALAEAIGPMGKTEYMPAILTLLSDSDVRVRIAATSALAMTGIPQKTDALMSRLADSSEEVRRIALRSLVSDLGMNDTEIRLLTQDLDAENPWIDPRVPITEERVATASKKLRLQEPEVRRILQSLNDSLGRKLVLTWIAQNGGEQKEEIASKGQEPGQPAARTGRPAANRMSTKARGASRQKEQRGSTQDKPAQGSK